MSSGCKFQGNAAYCKTIATDLSPDPANRPRLYRLQMVDASRIVPVSEPAAPIALKIAM